MKKFFTKLKDKLAPYVNFMLDGRKGMLIVFSVIAFILSGEAINSLFSGFNRFFSYLIGGAALAIICGLLYLITKLTFKNDSFSNILFVVTLILLILASTMASLDEPVIAVIYSLITVIALDLTCRCLYSLIVKKNKELSGIITGVLALAVTVFSCIFTFSKGFADSALNGYTKASELGHSAPEGFSKAVGDGGFNVTTVTYGNTNLGYDIKSESVDVSEMAAREGLTSLGMNFYFDSDLDEAPVSGTVWLPEGATN